MNSPKQFFEGYENRTDAFSSMRFLARAHESLLDKYSSDRPFCDDLLQCFVRLDQLLKQHHEACGDIEMGALNDIVSDVLQIVEIDDFESGKNAGLVLGRMELARMQHFSQLENYYTELYKALREVIEGNATDTDYEHIPSDYKKPVNRFLAAIKNVVFGHLPLEEYREIPFSAIDATFLQDVLTIVQLVAGERGFDGWLESVRGDTRSFFAEQSDDEWRNERFFGTNSQKIRSYLNNGDVAVLDGFSPTFRSYLELLKKSVDVWENPIMRQRAITHVLYLYIDH